MINVCLLYEDQIIKIENEITIGRAEESDIIINDQSISRRHCFIRVEGNSVIIEDSASSNGTILINSNGDIEDLQGKVVFDKLEELQPQKILLASGKYELEFNFPDLKTIAIPPDEQTNKLTIEKIKILTDICPNSGAVMLRRKLEEKLREKITDFRSEKIKDLNELINLAAEKLVRVNPSDIQKMERIRIAGNKGAHRENVSSKTVNECIQLYMQIENTIG